MKVESGLYNNASEVVCESLRLLLERDAITQRLREELSFGNEQLKRGEGVTVASREEFLRMAKGN